MIVSRLRAVLLAATLATVAVIAVAAEAHASNYSRARAAVLAEFGTGPTANCVLRIAGRETGGTYNPHAANWRDHHSDGSTGSFGLMQIGALWRREGESVGGFAHRMFGLGENLRVAHRLVRASGFAPWGGC